MPESKLRCSEDRRQARPSVHKAVPLMQSAGAGLNRAHRWFYSLQIYCMCPFGFVGDTMFIVGPRNA